MSYNVSTNIKGVMNVNLSKKDLMFNGMKFAIYIIKQNIL